MSECSICVTNESFKLGGKSKINANATIGMTLLSKVKGVAKLDPNKIKQPALLQCKLNSIGKIRSSANVSQNLFALQLSDNSNIVRPHLKINGVIRSQLSSKSEFNNTYVDKFGGSIDKISTINEFAGIQKLYPIGDIVTSLNNSYFVNKTLSSGNLYDSVDEGLFVGNYNQHLSKSQRISDDNLSFIQPSSIFTSGTFRYKCEVSRPYHHPKESFLFIRAAAPLYNYGSRIAPEYRIHNIKLEDPSGNLIVKYKDITLKGDADYANIDILNYATYISEPEINNAALNTWDKNYPILGEASGYTLNMDFDIICLDDPFSPGFSDGYEEKACELKFVNTSDNDFLSLDGAPLSTHTQGYHLNPTNTIRISAIEIANSGDLCNVCSVTGIKLDNYFGFYTEVNTIGQRLSRTIYPSELFINSKNVDIYPETYSTWASSPDTAYNTSVSGSRTLLHNIANLETVDYIQLLNSTPSSDSGRLTLKFNHKPPAPYPDLRNGAFDLSSSFAFDRANLISISEADNFFTIDSIELKVIAKKATGSRDYVLDVVGYSDDKILNVTPKIGAFLQNKHEIYYIADEYDNLLSTQNQELLVTQNQSFGIIPQISGFNNTNDLGMSSESLSDKDQYFESYLTSIDAGDHYKLSTLPVINSTQFKEYTIPLQIYEDYVTVGKPKDYSMSSYFENLYIDLYPIPSGASIASVRLIVNYKPSNGMMLHTFGTPSSKQLDRRDIKLLPIGVTKDNDTSLNNQFVEISYLGNEADDFIVTENNDFIIANSGFILSKINNIPHSYKEPETLKTNYSRRWRGVDGNIVSGPFDINQFDFSFYNPQSNHPFLNGYFDLSNVSGNYIISTDYASSGYYNGSSKIIKNVGLRFNNQQLFNFVTSYTTIDWTQAGNPIYGKICDAYDSAIRVSGVNGNINLGNQNLNNGFAFYTRFTPDASISGAGYNLFNSGIIASKWDSGNNLEFALGFKNGYISIFARDINNNIIELNDTTLYSDYQYPLSVVATYIPDSPSGQLRLYCNNELSTSLYLRDSKNIILSSGNSNLVVGHSYGSGVGINAFIHEIGLSTSGNLVHSSPNRFLKQTTVNSFLDGHSHTFIHNTVNNTKFKLHQYINDDTSLWKLGDFKTCAFSPDFDGFTTRIGKDYLIHTLKHHGSGYSQITNLPLPSSINASGLSYHSQIENDFIRFNLQDMPDANPEFYSVPPRICKTLPRNYDFAERAMVVDTVIEHETNNDILWPDGSIGPKLIVSLYSKNQDPVDRPSKKNWGLINRSIHYIPPSGCYEKISSTFNYNDLIDISESWAVFDLDNIRSEFDHKYYSKDINDMFLQYDIVYPSGSPFESTIKIHSANVRLENALTYWADNSNQINLYASGESIRYAGINLYGVGLDTISNSGLVLYTSGSAWPTTNSSMNLCVSGVYGIPQSQFNLFVKNSGIVSSLGPDLYVSGGYPRDEKRMSLVMTDNILDQTLYNTIALVTQNKDPVLMNEAMPLMMPESYTAIELAKRESLNLVVYNDQIIVNNINSNFNLYINTDLGYELSSGTFNLYTINYLAFNQQINQQASISWNVNNLGKSIDPIRDANEPYLEANDEIRGVDLLCYGDCNDLTKCIEKPISLHNIDWYASESCVDGGIFRAENTYTNLETSGFKTPIGYSGHFYGIRKYDGLIPNAPYNVTITTKTGTDRSIPLPTQFIEIDYGSNDYVNYSGVKFAADKNLDDTERQTGNKYGKSVACKQDLIAIGAPFQTVSYSEYDKNGNLNTIDLSEAGSVFLYRRNQRPFGYSWPENQHKSDWLLEEKLTLPSGLLKDYPTLVPTNIINNLQLPAPITQRYWNVGQEGRQFGHSLDIGINNNLKSFQEDKKEILVIGGPSAKWNRDFEDLSVSGVSVGLIVFTDEFKPILYDYNVYPPRRKDYLNVLSSFQNKDLIFTYFCDPPVKFNVKLIICEPISNKTNTVSQNFPEPKPSFIVKKTIPRNEGKVDENDALAVFSGIKQAFDEAFPYDASQINNNIPSMLGIYVDDSRSLGRSAVEPGLDRFISFYKDYSFASGLKDFFGIQSSGAVYEYDARGGGSEDWIALSQIVFNELLDTGRLIADNQVRFFASNIGPEYFNSNLSQFNYPPTSGGNVYVFEKESGAWNLIQEIKSPVVSYDTIDRFGHAVAISEDTTIIGIGSPYINECCKIYEHKPNEKSRLFNSIYSWLPYKNSTLGGDSIRYLNLMEEYENWAQQYGTNYANEILYSNLTSTEKFEARKYLNIQEYQNIFTYKHTDIPYVGTWAFIPEKFAPSSRLGYSVAINNDGSTVAFGAPTDSFNIFDDVDVYYKNNGYEDPLNIDNLNGAITPSWRSNVNSGAVRLFESRKYYPHNQVVEFGKFGNLQQSLNDPLDSGHFDYIKTIFSDKIFRKMTEEEVSIPQDAGLAFIITPGEDALSEEVLDNIISWLALGDRNLVLVGNDPVWENGGIYQKSNDIINKLLEALNSRMRLHPARNEYESLPSGQGQSIILPSFRPTNGTQTHISSFRLNTASGVADIRMHYPNFSSYMPCPEPEEEIIVNSKCELPLTHNGDLRAQWNAYCLIGPPDKPSVYVYPVNWPLVFKTFVPPCNNDENNADNNISINLVNHDVIPLLVAAETKILKRVIPAIPERSGLFPIYKERIVNNLSKIVSFENDKLFNTPAFIWDSGNLTGYNSYESNINSIINSRTWYKPPIVSGRESLLQAEAVSRDETVIDNEFITDKALYCVEQSHKNNETSKIIAIAGIATESQNILYSFDNNINFYANLVAKTVRGESNIAQLGGWTGRTSFKDGFDDSLLFEIFNNTGNDVYENVTNLSPLYNICWITNPLNIPSQDDLNSLISWLNTGNKKLIITHDNTIKQRVIVNQILELLNTDIRSLYLPVKEEYPLRSINPSEYLIFNEFHPVSNGFDKYRILSFFTDSSVAFYPFAISENINSICFVQLHRNNFIYDNKLTNINYFRLNSGLDKITFPVIPGSGYKLFISAVSEFPSENIPISIYPFKCNEQPSLSPSYNRSLISIQEDTTYEQYFFEASFQKQIVTNSINKIETISFNIQAGADENEIILYFNSIAPRLNNVSFVPKTCRLLSVSGVLLPIKEENIVTGISYNEIVGYEQRLIAPAIPEQVFFDNIDGPISSYNDKYCMSKDCFDRDFGGQLIADGPVVAAQEICFKPSFDAGVARSRITVISDSNLIQGRYMADEFGRMSNGTVGFIRSLYPETNFPSDNFGRQYTILTKIVSPERGSPQKYRAINLNNGLNYNFGKIYTSQNNMSLFNDKESLYDPAYVKRVPLPWSKNDTSAVIEAKKREEYLIFDGQQNIFGATAKFSGIIDGIMYEDVGIRGGIPAIMKDTGSDYLDFDRFPSGYPGDLFGHSISLHKNKLVVGSPFNAFSSNNVKNWIHHINTSGTEMQTSFNGGAGSVYIFDKTNKGKGIRNTTVPWEFIQKLRPQSINTGQDILNSGTSQSYHLLGPNQYTNDDLINNTIITDQFGYDVSIDSDILIVGAPGHDFGNISDNVYLSGQFIRKAFNNEFDIPGRIVTDLGHSGIRSLMNSGVAVLNNGAIFAFENSIIDWTTRKLEWKLIEKIVPQDRQQLKNENDNFGRSVYIHRSNRSDSDYLIIGGAESHDFSSSGMNFLNSAGAAYSHDIMLRAFPPVTPNTNTYIDIKLFGERNLNNDTILKTVIYNNTPNSIMYTSGIIYSNKDGAIFLEASGQDPAPRGFIEHRPYIIAIDGLYAYGIDNSSNMPLFIDGNVIKTENLNLFVTSTTGNVYNNLGLYNSSIVDFGSGILNFYTDCPDPTQVIESGLPLFMASGIGLSTDNLNLRIRGY
jgi:hypothetical protein